MENLPTLPSFFRNNSHGTVHSPQGHLFYWKYIGDIRQDKVVLTRDPAFCDQVDAFFPSDLAQAKLIDGFWQFPRGQSYRFGAAIVDPEAS